MIVDASALISFVRDEPTARWIGGRFEVAAEPLRMAWINIAEAGIVFEREGPGAGAAALESVARLGIEPLSPGREVVELVVRARHQFPLNFGDCFAYAHARLLGEPLLTLDADFLKTDLPNVLHPSRQ